MKFLAAANLTIMAIKARKERYVDFDKVNGLIVKLVQESENKYEQAFEIYSNNIKK